jgi:hypothetical protein
MNFLFWCEFPKTINWKELNSNLKFKADFYAAVNSKKEYLDLKKKLSSYKNLNLVGAWPTLPKEEGYWFSSFTSKKSIDKLKEFKGMKIKIDIEAPLPEDNSKLSLLSWVFKYLFLKPKNRDYLLKTINELGKENVIVSTFPFPNWILRRYGWENNFKHYNYMFYSSFVPRVLRPLYRVYYRRFIKKHNSKNTYFALGLLDVGIFGNEPIYKNIKQFESDLEFLKKNKVEKVVIFRLGSADKINLNNYKESKEI